MEPMLTTDMVEVTTTGRTEIIGEVEPITLMQGNCLDVMQRIRSGSIDMILTDLPYG